MTGCTRYCRHQQPGSKLAVIFQTSRRLSAGTPMAFRTNDSFSIPSWRTSSLRHWIIYQNTVTLHLQAGGLVRRKGSPSWLHRDGSAPEHVGLERRTQLQPLAVGSYSQHLQGGVFCEGGRRRRRRRGGEGRRGGAGRGGRTRRTKGRKGRGWRGRGWTKPPQTQNALQYSLLRSSVSRRVRTIKKCITYSKPAL